MLIKIKSAADWERWDYFIERLSDSSFLAYSFWLKTYEKIPFIIKKVGYLQLENDQIIAGISGIKLGFGKFSWLVFPSGPYGNSDALSHAFLEQLLNQPEIKMARVVQFAPPFKLSDNQPLLKGKKLKFIYLDPGFGNITLESNADAQLESLKYKVTRYIKAAINRKLELVSVNDERQLKTVYNLFKKNAKEAHYSIRPFRDYKSSWIESLKSKRSLFMLVKYGDDYKGAAWLINCGNKLHYIMGGTSKEKPRIDAGYFLHWHAILEGIQRGYTQYNISVGGTKSIEQFKDDFGRIKTNHIQYYYLDHGKSKK